MADKNKKSKIMSFLAGTAQGVTSDFGDEGFAASLAAKDYLGKPEMTLEQVKANYKEYRDQARTKLKQLQADNPVTYGAGELAGGVASPTPSGKARALGAAFKAALGGGLAGLGASESEGAGDVLVDAAKSAGTSAAFGTVLAGMGGVIKFPGKKKKLDTKKIADDIPVDTSYRGGHTAPTGDRDGASPLHNLSGTYPDDIYSNKAARIYGHDGGSNLDRLAISIMQEMKDSPDKKITIYRAVPYQKTTLELLEEIELAKKKYLKTGRMPKNFQGKSYDQISAEGDTIAKQTTAPATTERPQINSGDWVTTVREYAKQHGAHLMPGKYKIISQEVPAKTLFTDGNSIFEFGYVPDADIAVKNVMTRKIKGPKK